MPIAADLLLNELETRPITDVVREHVFEGEPVVFASAPDLYGTLRAHLSTTLGVDADGITIVGSGKIGYSLSPDSFGRNFLKTSDVDVVVVHAGMFDRIWDCLLDWQYPWHLRRFHGPNHGWAIERLEDLVCGRCSPSEIQFSGLRRPRSLTPLRDLSARWFDAFQSVGDHPILTARSFEGRLYRTWQHAMRYHASSLSIVARTRLGKGVTA